MVWHSGSTRPPPQPALCLMPSGSPCSTPQSTRRRPGRLFWTSSSEVQQPLFACNGHRGRPGALGAGSRKAAALMLHLARLARKP
eukprot:646603-Alexandrium_andersonii.AAC.1